MDWLSRLLAPLAAYPRWFVVTCAVLVAAGAGWVLVKVIKWTIYVVILLVLLGLVLLAVAWLLG
jgi:hypothetical protein